MWNCFQNTALISGICRWNPSPLVRSEYIFQITAFLHSIIWDGLGKVNLGWWWSPLTKKDMSEIEIKWGKPFNPKTNWARWWLFSATEEGRIQTQFVKIFLNVSLCLHGDLPYLSPHFAKSRIMHKLKGSCMKRCCLFGFSMLQQIV